MLRNSLFVSAALIVSACSPSSVNADTNNGKKPFETTPVATFNEPWAMTFLPDSNRALITEKNGKLKLWEADGPVEDVIGVPKVAYGGRVGWVM